MFIEDENLSEDDNEILSNSKLSEYFLKLCKDLDCLKPKKPVEVYKGLSDKDLTAIDSAVLNLADSLVNGLVNLGTSKDSLMNPLEEQVLDKEAPPWVTKVKDRGVMSTVASLGLIHLWNFEECSEAVSEYIELEDGYAKAGALIAWGLCNSGVWDENDPALALLAEGLTSEVESVKVGACVGLGLAYAGSGREDLAESLNDIIIDENLAVEVSGNATLALSMIHVSEVDEEVIQTIISPLMEFNDETLNSPDSSLFTIALGLNYLGQQSEVDTILEMLGCIEHKIGKEASLMVDIAAYAGTGNMLKIQEMFNRAQPHHEEKDDIRLQAISLIGMALISIGEKTGIKMLFRNVHHILQYCEKDLKSVAPIKHNIPKRNILLPSKLRTFPIIHNNRRRMSLKPSDLPRLPNLSHHINRLTNSHINSQLLQLFIQHKQHLGVEADSQVVDQVMVLFQEISIHVEHGHGDDEERGQAGFGE